MKVRVLPRLPHQGGAMVARLPVKETVAGPNPAPGAMAHSFNGRTSPSQGEDVGSTPAWATNYDIMDRGGRGYAADLVLVGVPQLALC